MVPTIAMTRSSTPAFSPPWPADPAGKPGSRKSCAICAGRGWVRKMSGSMSTLTAISTYIHRSQRRKLPLTVKVTRTAAATMTLSQRGTPK